MVAFQPVYRWRRLSLSADRQGYSQSFLSDQWNSHFLIIYYLYKKSKGAKHRRKYDAAAPCFYFITLCVWVTASCMCLYPQNQKRMPDPLEPDLQVVLGHRFRDGGLCNPGWPGTRVNQVDFESQSSTNVWLVFFETGVLY